MRCEYCEHSDEHGWWGDGSVTHCRDCHATWGGKSRAHCTCCHETFSTVGAADRAHKKDGTIYSPASMKRRGMEHRKHAYGMLWGYASTAGRPLGEAAGGTQ